MKCIVSWRKLPKSEQKYLFVSAIKTVVAITLFRCDKTGWHKDKLISLFGDFVSLFQTHFLGKDMSDDDLIDRYEKMLGVDFSIFDKVVEVR